MIYYFHCCCYYYMCVMDFQIHCAAASGNVKVLEWLVEEKFCSWKDAATGKPLVNASGLTVLAIAARRGDREMMRYAAQQMHCSVADITDIAVLQRGLHAALEVCFNFFFYVFLYIFYSCSI